MTKSGAVLLFGATGDLSQRMLLPSLFGLDSDGLLPPDFQIIGTARSAKDDDGFRAVAADALSRFIEAKRRPDDVVQRFLGRLSYVSLDASNPDNFAPLAQHVGEKAQNLSIFLSTAPSLFESTITGLAASGLAGPQTRLALEKPLGHDLASSQAINDAVQAAFPEKRIFRIDHYLGKETVQNLLGLDGVDAPRRH